jgi:hypothetical protein
MFAQNRIDFPVPKSFSGIDYGWSFINRNRVFYRRTFGSFSFAVTFATDSNGEQFSKCFYFVKVNCFVEY